MLILYTQLEVVRVSNESLNRSSQFTSRNITDQVIVTAQKMIFSMKNFFSKCDRIRSFLQIWPHLLKKSLMKNFIFCSVCGKFVSFYSRALSIEGTLDQTYFRSNPHSSLEKIDSSHKPANIYLLKSIKETLIKDMTKLRH